MSHIHVIDQTRVADQLITEWQIDAGYDPVTANLPTDAIGSMAHTPGYERIWELGADGWVEL